MNQKREDERIIYLYIYKQIIDRHGKYRIVATKDLLEILRRNIHNIPWKYYYPILMEMHTLGFLERINNSKFKTLPVRQNRLKKLDQYVFW